MSILPFFIFAIPVVFGAIATCAFSLVKEKTTIVLLGSVLGLSIATTLTYVLDMVLPMLAATLLTLALMTGGAVYFFMKYPVISYWKKQKTDWYPVIIFAVLLALFSIIAPKLLIADDKGLSTGIINAYGDVAWHLSNVTTFANEQSLPPENPIFSGERLTYPFLSNFFSAMLLAGGSAITTSVDLPALLLIPVLITLLYCLTKAYTDNKTAAVIATLLFLFGGGTLGWIRFGSDLAASNLPIMEFLFHLPNRDYSGVGTDTEGFHFLNPVTSLLLPQRSFLFGMPIAFSILLLLVSAKKNEDNKYIAAGLLAGMLPMFHAHTVLVLIPAIIALFIINPGKQWLLFALPAGIIGLPEVLYYARGTNQSGSFFRYAPGWMSQGYSFVWYWFQNTGLVFPVAIAGLFLPASKKLKSLTIAGLLLFIAGNTFLFAPWAWDNFKILVFWFIFSLPMIGYVAVWTMKKFSQPYMQTIIVTLIAFHMVSAGFDIWKLALPTAPTWQEWDSEGIIMAEKVKNATNKGDAVLTAAIHNSPVVLSGRVRYLGYAAHVWSHGSLPWDREKAIKEFYEGRRETLPETAIDYVFVGPSEKYSFSNIVIRPTWQLVTEEGEYSLYKVPRTASF